MKKSYFIAMILSIFAISTICLSCVNSSSSSGASKSNSKPDITGRYEAEDGEHFEFDCSDEAKEEIKEICALLNEDSNKYDGAGSYQYTNIKDGKPYFSVNLWCPFTIDGTKVTFDDSLKTVVIMSESYDSLTDSSGKTYTKTEKN